MLAAGPDAGEEEDDEIFDDKVTQDHLRCVVGAPSLRELFYLARSMFCVQMCGYVRVSVYVYVYVYVPPRECARSSYHLRPNFRLLFLVSLYSKAAENDDEKEIWIRSHAVMVLIFEGIVTGVLNYDYSSCAVAIGAERVWMNLSQEGKDDLDDLREMKMINTIKLSTLDQGSVQAYQISFKGQKLLKRKLTQASQDAVNSFCFTADGQPLHVGLQGGSFFFFTQDKEYKVVSKVTDTEDVSYVSSPYLPDCIRRGTRGMTSNAHRAYESASGKSDIKDEYSEVVSLGEVRVIIGEWLPFGDNAISCLMDKLGCQDRVQGGFFSDVIDREPQEEVLETPSGISPDAATLGAQPLENLPARFPHRHVEIRIAACLKRLAHCPQGSLVFVFSNLISSILSISRQTSTLPRTRV